MYGKIKNAPKGGYTGRKSVGAPKGGKFHFFYWNFLNNKELRTKYNLSFDWNSYNYCLQYVLVPSLYFWVSRCSSKKWLVVVSDKKELYFNYLFFKNVKQVINLLEEI